MILTCKECGKEFESERRSRQFCSRKCATDDRKRNPDFIKKLKGPKKKIRKKHITCKQCEAVFFGNENRKFCSIECGNKFKQKDHIPHIKICKECGKEFNADRKHREFCSVKCSNTYKTKLPSYIQNLKEGCQERSKNPEYLEKLSKATTKTWQKESFQKKMKEIHDSDEWIEKVEKNSLKFKDYILPNGKLVRVQGYENFALDKLLEKYDEDDLYIQRKEIEKEIGKIRYMFRGNEHTYFPDIFIKSENKIIEVKSSWTYKSQRYRNLAKKKRCLDMGFEFEFMIM